MMIRIAFLQLLLAAPLTLMAYDDTTMQEDRTEQDKRFFNMTLAEQENHLGTFVPAD